MAAAIGLLGRRILEESGETIGDCGHYIWATLTSAGLGVLSA